MLKLKLAVQRTAKLLPLATLLLAYGASAQTTIYNNATNTVAPSRNWSVLLSEKSVNSDGVPVITRLTGATSSACLDNTSNLQQQATFGLSVPSLSNLTYKWKAIGGIEIVGSDVSQTVIVRPVANATAPGKLTVDYTGTITSTRIVPYTYYDCACACTKSATTTFTDVENKKGQAFVNLDLKFIHNYPIVGPKCIAIGEVLTYSIAPLVSSYVASDGYNWYATPNGFTPVSGVVSGGYSSLDNSSITVTATAIPTSLSVKVGACNQNQTDVKTIVFGTKMTKPNAAIATFGTIKNPCLDASISQISLSVNPADNANIDYRWISDIAGTVVVSGSLNSNTVTLNIGSNGGKVYLSATPKTNGAFCTLNGPLYDTITINRGYTSASITGINGTPATTCVSIGQTYQYSATVNNAAIGVPVNWTLPAGMAFYPASPIQTSSTITVIINSAIANGASLTGSIASAPGVCPGTINPLSNLKTAPSLSAITAISPNTSTPNVFCVAPGAINKLFTAVAADYDYISWSSTGGVTGGGNVVYTASISNPFTSGSLTAVANRSGCPSTSPVTAIVKSNAASVALSSLTSSKTCYNLGIPDQVTLTTDAGYQSYTWTLPIGWTVLSGANTNILTFNTNGTTGTVTVKGVNECQTTAAKSITLTTNGVGQPISLATTTVSGAVSFTAPFISGAGYEWYKNGASSPLIGQNSNILQLTTPSTTANTYCVKVTLGLCVSAGPAQCATSSTYREARMSLVDLATEVTAYPSPANTSVIVNIPNPKSQNVTINVYNQGTGVKIASVTTEKSEYKFDTSNWVTGSYAIETILNGETQSTSVVVER